MSLIKWTKLTMTKKVFEGRKELRQFITNIGINITAKVLLVQNVVIISLEKQKP